MDAQEKKRLRAYIGEHLDISGARLKDDEVMLLVDFINQYDEQYRGSSTSRTKRRPIWGSDGKSIRTETFTTTFTDDIGIQEDYEYLDDDGLHGKRSSLIADARGIVKWLKDLPR